MTTQHKQPVWPFITNTKVAKAEGCPSAQSSRPYGGHGVQRVVAYSGGSHTFPRDHQFSGITGGGSHPLSNTSGVSAGGRTGGYGLGRSD